MRQPIAFLWLLILALVMAACGDASPGIPDVPDAQPEAYGLLQTAQAQVASAIGNFPRVVEQGARHEGVQLEPVLGLQ